MGMTNIKHSRFRSDNLIVMKKNTTWKLRTISKILLILRPFSNTKMMKI